MTEHDGTIGIRPHSKCVGTPMRNRVAHRCKQIRRKRTRTAGVSDYAAHLLGPVVKSRLS